MKKIEMYKCSICGETFEFVDGCAQHEEICWYKKAGHAVWIEDGDVKHSYRVPPELFGPHNYPYYGGTSDCSHGCGCWSGQSRSGGPVDPAGPCPKNPIPSAGGRSKIGENDMCPNCGMSWDNHEFGVPSPFCTDPHTGNKNIPDKDIKPPTFDMVSNIKEDILSLPRFTFGQCASLWCIWWGDGDYVFCFHDRQAAENMANLLNEKLYMHQSKATRTNAVSERPCGRKEGACSHG